MSNLEKWVNKVHCMDCLEGMKQLPDGCVSCVMFSPPYWSLRDYKVEGQIGLEKDFNQWLAKIWLVMDEIWRVMRKDGCVFINLGDTYGGSWGNYGERKGQQRLQSVEKFTRLGTTPKEFRPGSSNPRLPAKSLLMLPERFALGCIERGWILRNKCIWQKSNPMPCSAKDRFTTTWEYLYFFVKSNDRQFYYNTVTRKATDRMPPEEKKQFKRDWDWKDEHRVKKVSLWQSQRYWFDLDAVRRPHAESTHQRLNQDISKQYRLSKSKNYKNNLPMDGGGSRKEIPEILKQMKENLNPAGANPGDVIRFSSKEGNRSVVYGTKWSPKIREYNPTGKNPGDVITTKIPEDQAESMESPRVRQWRRKDCYEATAQEKKETGVSYGDKWDNPAGANPGDFMVIPTQPSNLLHYASFPEKLCEIPLKAGCPRWICKQCGKPRVRVTKKGDLKPVNPRGKSTAGPKYNNFEDVGWDKNWKPGYAYENLTTGWTFCSCLCPVCGEADCKCGEKWRPGIVLDPFVGTGTTCKVAKRLGFDWIGIDLKKEYCEIAEKEIKKVTYQEVLF